MNRSADETATEIKVTLAELQEIARRLELSHEEVERERRELMSKARELEQIASHVEAYQERRFWERAFKALTIILSSGFASALTFLGFLWFYRHGYLPWW